MLLFLLLALAAPQTAVRRHVENGYALAEKGDLKAAEAELREAVRLAPDDPLALATLGTVLSRTSRLEEANTYLERALKLDPAEPNTRYNVAFNLFRMGKTEAARANLERILGQKPDHKQAAALLAAVKVKAAYDVALERYRAGRFAESQALLERMISSGPRTRRCCGYWPGATRSRTARKPPLRPYARESSWRPRIPRCTPAPLRS
jgi:Flp pilus assembly protein TadD